MKLRKTMTTAAGSEIEVKLTTAMTFKAEFGGREYEAKSWDELKKLIAVASTTPEHIEWQKKMVIDADYPGDWYTPQVRWFGWSTEAEAYTRVRDGAEGIGHQLPGQPHMRSYVILDVDPDVIEDQSEMREMRDLFYSIMRNLVHDKDAFARLLKLGSQLHRSTYLALANGALEAASKSENVPGRYVIEWNTLLQRLLERQYKKETDGQA